MERMTNKSLHWIFTPPRSIAAGDDHVICLIKVEKLFSRII